jgi:hypothetical protein
VPAAATSKVIGGPLFSTGWSLIGGANTDEQALGDNNPATGIQSAGLTTNETRVGQLSPITLSGTVSWTFELSSATGTPCKIDILQGLTNGTVIASRTFSDLNATPTGKTITLSSAEKAAITDATQLAYKIIGNPA